MPKQKISEYDSNSTNNTDIDGVNIAESCPPSGINNAIREVMAHLKDLQSGVSGDTIPVASGGTGSGTDSGARTNLGLGTVSTLNSIATANIDADAVTNAKIADDSIDSEHYVDGSIDTAHIADDQITSAKIADNAVGADALNVSGNGTSGEALLSDGDGTFSWGSAGGITETTGSAPYYGARAWCDLDGSGTVTIDGSGNFSSVTDNGTGDYTLTFTTALPDTNYNCVVTVSNYSVNQIRQGNLHSSSARATDSVRIQCYAIAGGGDTATFKADYDPVSVTIFK
jgi:hypothetical protein